MPKKGKAMYEGAGKEENEEKKRGREERGKAVQRGVGKEERQERRRGKEEKFVRKQDDRDRMVTQREGQERKRPRKAEESRVQ